MSEQIKGYVQISRKICETVWYTGCSPAVVHLMFHLILSANYENKTWRGVKVNRGELVCSVGNLDHPGRLMEETRLPYSTLVRSLKKLEELGEITITSKTGIHGYTLIKITHYDTYTNVNTNADKKANTKVDKKAANSKKVKEAEELEEYHWDDD